MPLRHTAAPGPSYTMVGGPHVAKTPDTCSNGMPRERERWIRYWQR
ncbi:hypothetical protein E2C01_094502 [Portunus trituberculatus]|uniref:Uncharacterized protein n=1 Tax=Portunus trituberculatus TaxID=210409 RepID=A0A5B7JXS4_PORTR|nr:hypothetical protein [Portunus trituberculatus]